MAQANPPTMQQFAAFKPVLLLAGMALAVAAGISIYMWSRGADWTPVTTGLDLQSAAEVARELESAGISARVADSGDAVQVPRTALRAARMQLAGSDQLGQAGGFSMLSESPGFGVSQFMESARYQYALETELARTVASLAPVKSARVHLATARDSAFVRDRSAASASVVVELRSGRRLDAAQAQSIVNLVAASVPEMAPESVTVVDSAGNLLSRREGDDAAVGSRQQFDLARQTEAMLVSRIVGLLEAMVGEGHVRAQVTVEHDAESLQRASERLDTGAVVTRERLREERGATGRGAPAGAAANMPDAPEAAAPGQADAGAAGGEPTMRNVERDYAVGREYIVESSPAGRLSRISAAVLIDRVPDTDPEGEAILRAPEAAELARMRELVESAIGFDAERGDRLSIEHARFALPAGATESMPDALTLWDQAIDDGWLQMALRNLGGVLVLLVLIFTVLRPTLRALLQPVTVEAISHDSARPQLAGYGDAHGPGEDEEVSVREAPYERQLQAARTVVQQDPKRVAQLMRTWVGNDG